MKFLFNNILIYTNKEIAKKTSSLLETKNIKCEVFESEDDYKNMLEKIKLQQEFAVSIYEIKKNKNETIELIDRYPTVKFIFLYNTNLSVSDIYEILLKGAADVISTNSADINLIVAKVIALFRVEFKKTKNQNIISSDGNISLDTENLKLTINGKDWRLTKKQTAILAILLSNEGKIVERYKIASIVYSEKINNITPQLIDKHIQLIKEAIPPLALRIKSVWGVGYIYESK